MCALPAYEDGMITAIIETQNDEVRLAHSLAALVPAATEGVIREVIVVDHGSRDGTLIVADAAGCQIVRGGDEALRRAVEDARGEWLLFLAPSAVLAPGWQSEALVFIDRALMTGRARASVAAVRRGRLDRRWFARLRLWLAPGDGRLIARSAYIAAMSPGPSATSSVSDARRGAA